MLKTVVLFNILVKTVLDFFSGFFDEQKVQNIYYFNLLLLKYYIFSI